MSLVVALLPDSNHPMMCQSLLGLFFRYPLLTNLLCLVGIHANLVRIVEAVNDCIIFARERNALVAPAHKSFPRNKPVFLCSRGFEDPYARVYAVLWSCIR